MKLPFGKIAVSVSTVFWMACSGQSATEVEPFTPEPVSNEDKKPAASDESDTETTETTPPAAVDAGAGYTPDPELGLSKGCERTEGGEGLQERTMMVGGVKRSYDRFIPAAYKPKKPMMLIVGLHGSGGTSKGARSTFEMEAEAKGQAVFLYPQALPNDKGENRWNPDKDSVDYQFFDAIVNEAMTTHCIDRDRVYVVGFSLGARFGAMLGCHRGDVIRAVGLAAPGGDENTLPLTGCVGEVALWEGLGTKDDELHKTGAARVRDHYLGANACAATKKAVNPKGCETYDACHPGAAVTFCSYDLGHAFPPVGPGAIFDFFARYE